MKKICVIHGVGYEHSIHEPVIFAARVSTALNVKCEPFIWSHHGEPPVDDRKSLLFPTMRAWVHEVLMDFAYTTRYLREIVDSLPDADMYIGHSAGGVIAAECTGKPIVVFGTPVQLIRNVEIKATRSDVLNIMHYRDPIAAPIEGAENVIVRKPLVWSWINPVAAHTSYWANKEVMEHTVRWYKQQVEGK